MRNLNRDCCDRSFRYIQQDAKSRSFTIRRKSQSVIISAPLRLCQCLIWSAKTSLIKIRRKKFFSFKIYRAMNDVEKSSSHRKKCMNVIKWQINMRPLSSPPKKRTTKMHNKIKCNKISPEKGIIGKSCTWIGCFLQADNCRFLHPLIAIVVNNKT